MILFSSIPNTKPLGSTKPTGMPTSIPSGSTAPAGMPASSTPPAGMPTNGTMDAKTLKAKISQLTNVRDQLSTKVTQIIIQKQKLESQIKIITTKKQQMNNALVKIENQKTLLNNTLNITRELKQAVPPAFEKSKNDYLSNIEAKRPKLEGIFQSTLNGGFKQMYITVFFINLVAFVVLLLYKKPLNSK